MAGNDLGFSVDGWGSFVSRFASLVENWEEKKAVLLQRIGSIYQAEIIPNVPVDTSRLVGSIFVVGDGIPQDYVEVGTNVKYALYVNDGHVQHRRFLPADKLSTGGKAKYLRGNKKGILLKERYVQGAFFMEKGFNSAKPRIISAVNSFMVQIAREVEGGSQ